MCREEVERRWKITTSQWPIMNVILHGVNRDQLMARHKANHAQVAYGNDLESAKKAMWTKAAMFHGIHLAILRNSLMRY
jgi:L-fucose isomerase-like protein